MQFQWKGNYILTCGADNRKRKLAKGTQNKKEQEEFYTSSCSFLSFLMAIYN
jgi:hypothetical protein